MPVISLQSPTPFSAPITSTHTHSICSAALRPRRTLGGFFEQHEPMVRQFNVHGAYSPYTIVPVPVNLLRPALKGCGCPIQLKQRAHSHSTLVFTFHFRTLWWYIGRCNVRARLGVY